MVRNVFLIFIHDKLSINEVRIKVTQATLHCLPQRLKLTFFEIILTGAALKRQSEQ